MGESAQPNDTASSPSSPDDVVKSGSLTVIGTGIRTVGQLTTEAIACMQQADELIHLVSDPIAEVVIRRLKPGREVSLHGFYSEGKQRIDSYNEMVEFILSRVRSGANVCAAFYGHPGVFAFPSHESIRRARAEGFRARMLPGISAEDCLIADLGVDPAVNGCQSYEATDFLMNAHNIDPSSQLILWQAGALGDWTYQTSGYNLKALPLLVEKLLTLYPPDHQVVVYEGAIFPGCPPVINPVCLRELDSTHLNAASTLYLAPSRPTTLDDRYANELLSPASHLSPSSP
jgi:uncharacterized protein YabN with tetrapyrrole methylase and pyrophosphatase domain